MSNLRTKINWMLNDYCTASCSYCPTRFYGGEMPRGILEYMEVTKKIIDHYDSLDRKIDWFFDGGEPLDMFDFPMMLKLCKERGGNIDLKTNGGKLWLDWWAIEPHIDSLHLSYHYWQNPNLIRFIIQAFQKANKPINLIVPIRPDHFNEDMQRAKDVETEFNIVVSKTVLYIEADNSIGMFPYTQKQLRTMSGDVGTESGITRNKKRVFKNKLVKEQKFFKDNNFKERNEIKVLENPSYSGMLCNAGIERLIISHNGWATGSWCNDKSFGSIWDKDFVFPVAPHSCGMQVCSNDQDRAITKFKP